MADTIIITPQGYSFGSAPRSFHPFWDDDNPGSTGQSFITSVQIEETDDGYNITVTDNNDKSVTTEIKSGKGTAGISPTVTATGNTGSGELAGTVTGADGAAVNIYNGAQGEKGETGATGATGAAGPQGEKGVTGATGAQGIAGVSPTVTATGNTGSGELAGTVTGADGVAVNIYNGAQGEKGETGATGATGAAGAQGDPVSKAGLVTGVTMTNENGVYTFKETKYNEAGTATAESEIGTIEVSGDDNGIVEVKDTVVTNDTTGYDFHTFTETQNDGTENEVGKFYLAQKQITGITEGTGKQDTFGPIQNYLKLKTVNQSGTEAEETIYLTPIIPTIATYYSPTSNFTFYDNFGFSGTTYTGKEFLINCGYEFNDFLYKQFTALMLLKVTLTSAISESNDTFEVNLSLYVKDTSEEKGYKYYHTLDNIICIKNTNVGEYYYYPIQTTSEIIEDETNNILGIAMATKATYNADGTASMTYLLQLSPIILEQVEAGNIAFNQG